MEAEHTGNLVEKAVALVKDMFGIPTERIASDENALPLTGGSGSPPVLSIDDAMRLDPHAYNLDTIAEVHEASARRQHGE